MKCVRALRVAVAAIVGALALGTAACTLPTRHSETAEPVTVTHAMGSTTVVGTPKRIVTLGNQWTDTTLALGVTPVGHIAVLPDSAAPWEPTSLRSAKSLDTTGNMTEQIAALHPDLILVDGLLADRKTYDELSSVAPTVSAMRPHTADPWPERVTTLGRILRTLDQADEIMADIDQRLATIAQANPTLRGNTLLTTWLASDSQLIVHTSQDTGTGPVFTRARPTNPRKLTAVPATQGRLSLSPDRVDELTADILLAGCSPGLNYKYRQLPDYITLPAVRKNAVVFLTTQEISAIDQPTALSLPYLLDKLASALASAAK